VNDLAGGTDREAAARRGRVRDSRRLWNFLSLTSGVGSWILGGESTVDCAGCDPAHVENLVVGQRAGPAPFPVDGGHTERRAVIGYGLGGLGAPTDHNKLQREFAVILGGLSDDLERLHFAPRERDRVLCEVVPGKLVALVVLGYRSRVI